VNTNRSFPSSVTQLLVGSELRKTDSKRKPSVFTAGGHMRGFVSAKRLGCPGDQLEEDVPGRFGLEMNQSNPKRTVFLASIILLATCGVGGQTAPLPNLSVTEKPPTRLSATNVVEHKGLFTIDFSVTNAGGSPVSDLAAGDLTLLDNGQPAKIRTFNHTSAPTEPAAELIFVIDAVDLTPQQLTEAESSLVRFLQRSNGHLPFRCSFYRLTSDGLFSSLRSSMDGALLIEELKETRSLLPVWRAELRSWESGLTPNRLSLSALGAIAISQRDVPGHKVLVWIGPGWPVNGGDVSFDEATELSTRLREARITLDNLNVWLSPIAPFNYRDLLDAPRSQKDMQPAKMSLQVIATQTGGLVLDSSEDLDLDIERCVQEIRVSTPSPSIRHTQIGLTNTMTSESRLVLGSLTAPSLSAPPPATTTSLSISTILGLA
jgi:VWFA-related protein